ncbi:helix-turn-helix domain-containing protein [Aidingimonas lacisalsi]|uniref:helix-turn-helix domain-containing protein n=1 Tax=Aidingimonas lacisalsi TaxID=2604086 RepID=UPI0011D21A3F|nr:helix-turn-helix domain-containing protein [Aidingimonas lacisalsi]
MQFNDLMQAEIWLQQQIEAAPSLDALASRLGYSSVHLNREFNAHFGVPAGQYRDTLRLERAALLLGVTQRSVTDIAIECGYSSSPVLSRAFRGHFQMSPREFRRQFQAMQPELVNAAVPDGDIGNVTMETTTPAPLLVVRHYGYDQPAPPTDLWQVYANQAPTPPPDAQPCWIYHDHPGITPAYRVRIDFGYRLPHPPERPAPLPFRHDELGVHRVARLVIDDIDRMEDAFAYLVLKAIPESGETPSGEAASVVWRQGRPGDDGKQAIELRVPVSRI